MRRLVDVRCSCCGSDGQAYVPAGQSFHSFLDAGWTCHQCFAGEYDWYGFSQLSLVYFVPIGSA
jgi:hypothetical protein